jgi:zinc transport system substrate-binding protein
MIQHHQNADKLLKVTRILTLLAAAILSGCQTDASPSLPTPTTDSRPLVAATNGALSDMARSLIGDVADVFCPDSKALTNENFEADQLIRLQQSEIIFTNGPGANDAQWLDLISLQNDQIHATTNDQFELNDFIQVQDYRTVHSHGDQGEHSHPWMVPHCWLSPRLAIAQSVSMGDRLVKLFPQHHDLIRKNQALLQSQLEDVITLAQATAKQIEAETITVIASDPRLLFFTRALNQTDNYFLWFDLPNAVKASAELRERLPKGKVLMLWAEAPGELVAATAELKGVLNVVIERLDDDQPGQYLSLMRKNFAAVKSAIEGATD